MQEAGGIGLEARQTGDAEFHLTGGTVASSASPPLKLTFQTIDLSQPWPGGIRGEHFTGRDSSGLNAAMAFVYFLSAEKIGLDFSEPGLGIFRGKELLDVFVEPELIFLNRNT